MFTISLREILTAIGLTLLLTLSIGSVVSAAPPAAPALQADGDVGVLIVSVRANSPAAKAGLVRGDIVLAVDDEAVDDADALAAAILAHDTGDEIVLTALHGSDTVELPVILGERYGRTYLGVQPYAEAPNTLGPDLDAEDEASEETEKESHDADDGAHEETDDTARAGDKDAAPSDEDVVIEDILKGVFPMDEFGAMVAEVIEDGPAAAAGLAEGDLILSVNGESLSPDATLGELIGAFAPGDEVTLTVRSADAGADEAVEVVVTLGAHPEDEDKAFLGVSYMPTPMMFSGLGRLPFGGHMPLSPPDVEPAPAPDEEAEGDEAVEEPLKRALPMDEFGAMIAEVVEDSPAAQAGLTKGDLILTVDGEPISPEADLAALIGALEPGDEVTLEVRSADADEVIEVVVTLDAHPEDEDKAFLGISYMPIPMMFEGRGRMPFAPRGIDPAPEQDDGDICPHHRHHRGDKEGGCDHEGRHPHHGFDRFHGFHGMMPFFGMEGHDFQGFDLDQLSEEELERLQEMMPFLFPDVEAEPESGGGV